MKKVFQNHSQVCHAFNLQNQNEGRAGSIFFEGNKIYSYGYHYTLGIFINPDLIFINNKGYSNSTSKHIHKLIQATRDKRQILATEIDLNWVLSDISQLYKSLLNARKYNAHYFNSIISLHKNFNKNKNILNGFFIEPNYLGGFQFVELSKTSKEHKEKLNRIEEIFNLAYEYSQSEKYLAKIERAKELEATKEQRQKEKREKQRAVQTENFYNYKGSRINWLEFDLLRLSKCGEYVETSQAVKIPIKEAQRYYRLFSSGAKLIGEKISQYTTISNDNYLKIGCHKIEHKEANRIGQLIIE